MPEDVDTQAPLQRMDTPKFLTQTRFDDFELPEELLKGLTEAGFVQCSPIQAQTLPVSLAGRDVAGQAQTGTGKTAAFLVTAITRLLSMPDREPGVPSALMVAPTRELALQIYEEAMLIGKYTGLTAAQIVGGVDYGKQADILRKGVDMVICTPGRILDYMKQGIFKPGGIRILVIDEADRLLDLGFEKDMRFLLRKLPPYEKRQSMLFSATLSYRVMELTYEYMNLPEFIAVTPEEVTVKGIGQELYHVGVDRKLALLLGLLQREDWTRALIFVNTKSGVEWLTEKLKGNGWPAEGITGDLPQTKRFHLMDSFKNGQIKILVATDVASRGIHVEDISHVFNYDLPQDAENYVHRIGRTARAGKTGRALSLACDNYVFHLEPMEELLDYKIPVVWPEEDWYVEDKAGPVKSDRRRRDRKPGPNRTRTRVADKKRARPVREKPVGDRPVRDRPVRERSVRERPAMVHRHGEYTPKRTPGYCPGTFFGFAVGPVDSVEEPDLPEQTAVASVEQPAPEQMTVAADGQSEAPAKTAAPAKKRRRPRRRRRSPAGGAKEAQADGSGSDEKIEPATAEPKSETVAPETPAEG
ncbi:MAG: DEAD/DEAH box helicase [Desulfobacterales bacterium]|nr:DEAD/DEAH box helicase [Desulfobacterales bacterium]